MTLPAPTYDLVLLLDPAADDTTRAKLVADTRASIEAQGELLRHDEWGERALTYPIDKKTSARYHLLQFHVSATELLSSLDRTLRLADEVLRFRIIKLAPGVGAPPSDMAAGAAAAPSQAPAEPEQAPAAETQAPAVSETPAEVAPAAEAAEAPAQTAEAPAEDAEVAVGEPS
jgi:small subunit ribosomal protein S6